MAVDGPQPSTDLDLLAASLRADGAETGTFVEALAAKLEGAVPALTRVQRSRGKLFGPKFVDRITVDAGDRRLELKLADGAIQTSASRLSGGVVIKTEPLDTDAWLTALSEALADQAQRNASTRQALERLLNE